MSSSPISKINLDGRNFYIKRDDLIDPFLAGNKYRKLYALLQTPREKYTKIISYGGTQSNAMLAIAAVCEKKDWEFIYYSKPISKVLKSQNNGNFYQSKQLGMQHIELELESYKSYISSLRMNVDAKTFVIDQGGAHELAKLGINILADEIKASNLEVKSIATPSGTGTTALYLALALPQYKVYTTACVGDAKYLRQQMSSLDTIPKNLIILEAEKKYHFAKLYPEFLKIYQELLSKDIEFDLLYAPGMFKVLLEQTKEDILYIHSGGVTGNESMLERYKNKIFR